MAICWLATRVRNCIRCNHHRMDRKSSVQPIRLNSYIKESNESLRDSSVTVVCWHIDVTNLQRYILNHGPARPGPPRVSAFHPVQPRPCQRPPPNSIQSSRVTRPGRLSQSGNVQTPPSESELRQPRHRPGFITPGRLRVPLVSIACVSGSSPIPEPDAPAASR